MPVLAARTNGKQIHMAALEEAIDRVMTGPARKSVLLSEKERKLIAYHEGGHALVWHAMANADPVHKVTIIPRGRALRLCLPHALFGGEMGHHRLHPEPGEGAGPAEHPRQRDSAGHR